MDNLIAEGKAKTMLVVMSDGNRPASAFTEKGLKQFERELKESLIPIGGKEDIAYENCHIMMRKFDEMNIDYTYSDYPGGHTWPVWRNNLHNFSQKLL